MPVHKIQDIKLGHPVYNFDMAGEKRPITPNTNTISTAEVCQLLAIGYVSD